MRFGESWELMQIVRAEVSHIWNFRRSSLRWRGLIIFDFFMFKFNWTTFYLLRYYSIHYCIARNHDYLRYGTTFQFRRQKFLATFRLKNARSPLEKWGKITTRIVLLKCIGTSLKDKINLEGIVKILLPLANHHICHSRFASDSFLGSSSTFFSLFFIRIPVIENL